MTSLSEGNEGSDGEGQGRADGGTADGGGVGDAEAGRRGETEAGRRFFHYLAELRATLDPESFALVLRILEATDQALEDRRANVDVPLSPREQELFTPEFGENLRALMDLLVPAATDVAQWDEPVPDDLEDVDERERLRREVEAIARASGLASWF